uniref:Uncharacterized protein n=1 Tax=Anopheles christyi TaxID=43041 RepID=A0A182KII7_9DIPT
MHARPVTVTLTGRRRWTGGPTVRSLVLKVLLQVVKRLWRTTLGRRLLGLALPRMVRGLMMRLMVRLMMWWWLMVLRVLLLLLGRLRMYASSAWRTRRHSLDLPRSTGTTGCRWSALSLLRLLYMIIYMTRTGSTRPGLSMWWSPGAWRLMWILVRRVLRVRWRWSTGTHVIRHTMLPRIAPRWWMWWLRTSTSGRSLRRLCTGRWRWSRYGG